MNPAPFQLKRIPQRGASMIEFTVIAPVVLLLGLGMFQVAMLMHTKNSLNYALQEAARMGAVSNGDLSKIEDGLAAGLVPFRGGGSNIADLALKKAEILLELAQGKAQQWYVMKQLSPTTSTFVDWAEDTVDDAGNTVKEIPNANLAFLRCTKAPQAGSITAKTSSACASGEPVGASSKQTLADANLLKLKLTYGVKVAVPIVGTIIAKSLSMAAGCKTAEEIRVGALALGTPTVAAQPADCFFYDAVDLNGRPEPRLPISIEVTMRMQSPLRTAGNGSSSIISANTKSANTTGPSLGNGTVDAASEFAPVAVATLNPNGLKYADDKIGNPSLVNDAKGFGGGNLVFGTTNDWGRTGNVDPGPGGGSCKPPPRGSLIPPAEEPPGFTPIPQEPRQSLIPKNAARGQTTGASRVVSSAPKTSGFRTADAPIEAPLGATAINAD